MYLYYTYVIHVVCITYNTVLTQSAATLIMLPAKIRVGDSILDYRKITAMNYTAEMCIIQIYMHIYLKEKCSFIILNFIPLSMTL